MSKLAWEEDQEKEEEGEQTHGAVVVSRRLGALSLLHHIPSKN